MDVEQWLISQGFQSRGIAGLSKFVPTENNGAHPVELGFQPAEESGWWGYLLQSNSNDHVLITGRSFYTIEDCKQLMIAVGLSVV